MSSDFWTSSSLLQRCVCYDPPVDIYSFLDQNGIAYQCFDHPAVFTCEDAERFCLKMPGVPTKNLLLRDRDGKRHFLVMVGHEKQVDLKGLKDFLGVSKLSFTSPERLKKYLGVEPGSVTLLGVVNDADHGVTVVIDEELWGQSLQCHPLVNTATLVLSHEDVEKFLNTTHTPFRIIKVP